MNSKITLPANKNETVSVLCLYSTHVQCCTIHLLCNNIFFYKIFQLSTYKLPIYGEFLAKYLLMLDKNSSAWLIHVRSFSWFLPHTKHKHTNTTHTHQWNSFIQRQIGFILRAALRTVIKSARFSFKYVCKLYSTQITCTAPCTQVVVQYEWLELSVSRQENSTVH